MRTIRTKIYQFNELNDDAKNLAIENYRNNNLTFDFIYSDAEKTVNAFNNVFGIRSGRNSWLDFNASNIDDSILELKGLRLHKYIVNNYFKDLFKRKFYNSFGDNKKVYHPCVKINLYNMEKGARVNSSNFYYSRIQFVDSCVLTGMCYDDDILQPIYNFLKFPNENTNFEELINECFNAMRKTLNDEESHMNTDQYITEEIEANEYEFTKDGKQF